MVTNLFLELAVIDWESEVIDYEDLQNITSQMYPGRSHEERAKLIRSSYGRLYKIWRFLYKLSPNISIIECILTKLVGRSITVGPVTIYGCNAMMWYWEIYGSYKGDRGYWLFRPPCFKIFGHRGFTLGRLYWSPDGTPGHGKAKNFYGKESGY
jgi:hypothetical protein